MLATLVNNQTEKPNSAATPELSGVEPARSGRLKYRADIDGLRAVAVLSVMAFHMELAHFTGGFVGVDVFFVISGYLISAIVFSEISDGTYSITSFYERRIRRIFPALFAMLVLFSACTLIYIFPSEMVNYAKSLLAATLSVSNFYFWQHSGYFDSPTSNPLLHTWSLAVEEQFYILFPIYLWAVRRFYPKRLRLSVGLLVVASLFASAIVVHFNRATAFYMPYTRAWELLTGTVLALNVLPRLSSTWVRNCAALLGIVMIGYSVLTYTPTTLFPGLSALAPCGGAALIIYAGEAGSTLVGRALSWRPVVFFGLISYSLYLWHWPVILLHKTGLLLSMTMMPAGFVERLAPRHYDYIVEVAVSVFLAFLSWKFVENPFRAGRLRLSGRPLFLMAGGTATACIMFSVFAISSSGIQGRMSPDAERIASYHSSFRQSFRMGSCFLTPEFSMKDFDFTKCMHVEIDRKNYLILGDSHAATIWPGVASALAPSNVLQANVSACRPILRQSATTTCHQMMNYVFDDFLIHNKIDGLLLQARWETRDVDGLTETIKWANQHNVQVILLGTYPEYDAPLPRLLGYSIAWNEPNYPSRHRLTEPPKMDALLQQMAASVWHVPYVSLYKALCQDETCAEYADSAHNIPLLTDTDHFTEPGSVYAMKMAISQVQLNADPMLGAIADEGDRVRNLQPAISSRFRLLDSQK
jgi:peptidoglycan/LPS O-acetylase OafA/YrhL